LFLAKGDGSESHRLLPHNPDRSVWAWSPRWSPDGARLRFEFFHMERHVSELWEIDSDGRNIHLALPKMEGQLDKCCSAWTPDGKYSLFRAWKLDGRRDLWAMRENAGWFQGARHKPVQLSAGPIEVGNVVPSRDGKTLFTTGTLSRGEMMRFDAQTRRFTSFLPEISAESVSYSRDGAWMAYIKLEELWRSRTDGSERLQLAFRLWVCEPTGGGGEQVTCGRPGRTDFNLRSQPVGAWISSPRLRACSEVAGWQVTHVCEFAGFRDIALRNRTGDMFVSTCPGSKGLYLSSVSTDNTSLLQAAIDVNKCWKRSSDGSAPKWLTLIGSLIMIRPYGCSG
jgi:hypothetical protein